MFDMGMRPGPSAWPPGTNPGRTHQFYTGTPVWPFGYGLSYTTWRVAVAGPSRVSLEAARSYVAAHSAHGGLYASTADDAPTAQYSVNVTNTGTVDSDYTVLGFLKPPGAGTNGVPLETLFGFERVRVRAGDTVTVWLGVGARALTHVTRTNAGASLTRQPLPGTWILRVGITGEAGGAQTTFEAI